MSEYQFLEFLVVDRPLTAREMDHLRGISTRAQITPVSFINEYSWGGLNADPSDFMRHFFDAHVFIANWGDAFFMVRLPRVAEELMGVAEDLGYGQKLLPWLSDFPQAL